MAKALHYNVIPSPGIWYQELAPKSFYSEEDLERVLVQTLENIFSKFVVIPFKLSLHYESKINKPDLALIKKDYTEWYIIEVELGGHQVDHVIEQIDTFANATFNTQEIEKMAKYIKSQYENFDLESIQYMLESTKHHVMVIVNQEKRDWKEKLEPYGCKLCVFQIYQSKQDGYIYRLSGDHPFIYTDFCHCIYEKEKSPYIVKILDSNFLHSYNYSAGNKIDILYNGIAIQWQIITSNRDVYLHAFTDYPPLDPLRKQYKLTYDSSLEIFSFIKD